MTKKVSFSLQDSFHSSCQTSLSFATRSRVLIDRDVDVTVILARH